MSQGQKQKKKLSNGIIMILLLLMISIPTFSQKKKCNTVVHCNNEIIKWLYDYKFIIYDENMETYHKPEKQGKKYTIRNKKINYLQKKTGVPFIRVDGGGNSGYYFIDFFSLQFLENWIKNECGSDNLVTIKKTEYDSLYNLNFVLPPHLQE